jgi:hypothetical protein
MFCAAVGLFIDKLLTCGENPGSSAERYHDGSLAE